MPTCWHGRMASQQTWPAPKTHGGVASNTNTYQLCTAVLLVVGGRHPSCNRPARQNAYCSSSGGNTSSTTSSGGVGGMQQAQRSLPLVRQQSHNNAVPMPRGTAAAATAVAVAAPAVQPADLYRAPSTSQQRELQLLNGNHMLDAPALQDTSTASTAGMQDVGPARPTAAAKASRMLTRDIMACSSVQELQQLVSQHEAQLNIIHVSALFKQLTRCQQQQQQQRHELCLQLERLSMQLLSDVQLPRPGALQVLQAAAGTQVLQHSHVLDFGSQQHHHHQQQQQQQIEQQWLPADVQHHHPGSRMGSSRAGGAGGHSPAASQPTAVMPQQLSTISWCCANLGHTPSEAWWSVYWTASTPLLRCYSPRELATAIAAAGKLQQVPPASWMAGFEAACVAGGLCGANPQELCMMLRGVAVLRLQPGQQWVQALQGAVLQQLEALGPRDISQVLWGHASLALQPPGSWLAAVLAAAGQQLHCFTARDTAMLLWALAALRQRPDSHMLAILLDGLVMSSCKLRTALPQDFAHISWAVTTFQQLPVDQQQGTAGASSKSSSSSNGGAGSSPGSSSSSSSSLSGGQWQAWFRLVWQMTGSQQHTTSYSSSHPSSSHPSSSSSRHSALAPVPAARQQQSRTALSLQQQQQQLTSIDAAQLLWSASQLDRSCWPSRNWISHFWSRHAGPKDLAHASAHSITVTLWASLRMGHRPPGRFLAAAVPVLQRQLAELQPAAACQLLCVLAKLQHRPNPAFMEQLLSRLQLDCHLLQPRAFACVLWALGCLGFQPGATWWATVLQHLQGIVGQLGERELANVVFGLVATGVCGGGLVSVEGRGVCGSERVDGGGGRVCLPQQLRGRLLARAMELGASSAGVGAGRAAAVEAVRKQGKQLPLSQLAVFLD